MKILRSDIESAAQKGIITPDQARQLWSHFETLRPDQAQFQALHVLYYFGGILILASMTWFLTNAWQDGAAVMAISGLFAFLYVLAGRSLWTKQNLKIPGGLLITAAVGLTPVFIYGFQTATGTWIDGNPQNFHDYHFYIKSYWFFMELGTIFTALIALRFFRFPFITFPLALTLWYMSMDLVPLLFGISLTDYEVRKIVSMTFGFFMLLASYFIDKRIPEQDFAFWTYLYGMMAFWGGLSLMDSDSELSKLIYCLLNLVFIVLSVYLRRRVFLVFGTMGVLGYLSHLAWKVFKDSLAFPIALALLGIVIVYIGVKYQNNKSTFEKKIETLLPSFLMKWRPEERT